ncbi:MAG: DUF5694 domain-containing protein [Chitinophagaceae bacterium]
MKKYISLLLPLLICLYAQAQQKKIKVLLVGTFHFAQTDTLKYDIMTPKRQQEVLKMVSRLEKFRPDKIFIEQNPEFEYVNKRDSLYQAYLNGTFKLRRNEIYQVAFRMGKDLGHKTIYQCDHPGSWGFFYTTAEKYARTHDQQSLLDYTAPGTTMPETKRETKDSLRNALTLQQYLRWMNGKTVQSTTIASYLNVFVRLGNTDVFPKTYDSTYFAGVKLVGDWYRRNIWIYTKILAQIDYSEKSLFLIIGNDHVPVLKHLFESNPYFEVVNTLDWL